MFQGASYGVRVIGNLILICLILTIIAYGSAVTYEKETGTLMARESEQTLPTHRDRYMETSNFPSHD